MNPPDENMDPPAPIEEGEAAIWKDAPAPAPSRTKLSQPYWAESPQQYLLKQDDIREYAFTFSIVMGIPATSAGDTPPWYRRVFGAQPPSIPNYSYCQAGVLYLTPDDFNLFMDVRRKKDQP